MKQMKTILVVSLLLACVFAPGVGAADNETTDTITVGRSVGAQFVRPHVSVANQAQMDQYANITAQQLNSRQALINAKNQRKNAETPEELEQLKQQLQTKAQEHLVRTIDRMIGRLERLQGRVSAAEQQGNVPEGASENLDRYLLRLEGKKLEAENADTPADIISAVQDIRGEWGEIRREISHHTRYMLTTGIGNYVEKSEGLSIRLDAEISKLADKGIDTTSLEDKHDRLDDKIDCVRANYILAKDALEDSDPDEVSQAVHRANTCIRDANQITREIFMELREYRAGSVILNGTGTLTAEGSGTALVRGNIKMQLSADAGSLSVVDRNGDMVITTTGDGDKTDDGSMMVYTGFNGDATISGSDVVVTITGTRIGLAVNGTGTTVLIGTGSYEVTGGRSGEWRNQELESTPTIVSKTAVEDERTSEDESEDEDNDEHEDETNTGNESINTSEEA
ncbi:MAG: hypothetical protein EF813_05845 [Methanosarcinales archaeon]|nr:MAG: hypothetical protein EF813_05845 [Methanosarcinales archaeon]